MTIAILGLIVCFTADPAPRRLQHELSHRNLLDRLTRIATTPPNATKDDAPRPVGDLTNDELLAELSYPSFARRPMGMEPPLAFLAPWKHPAASEIILRCQSDVEDHRWFEDRLTKLQRSPAEETAFLSSFTLAKLGHHEALDTLSTRLLDDRSPVAMRCLAVEALCQHLERVDLDPLQSLLQQWLGDPNTGVSSLRLTPEDEAIATAIANLYALTRARLPDPSPESDPWIGRMSRIAIPSIRRAAAMSYSGHPYPEVPPNLKRLLADSEPQVRRAALASLLSHPNDAARPFVLSMTADADLNVAALAIGGLSNFNDLQSSRRLDELQKHPSAVIRQAVAGAAGKFGQESTLLRMLDDKSGEVRAAAALALSRFQTPTTLDALKRLASDDRSTVVQSAALRSIAQFPADTSIPLLLDAMNSSSARARQTASQLVADSIPQAREFDPAASPEMRKEQLDLVRNTWEGRKSQSTSLNPRNQIDLRESTDLTFCIRDWFAGDKPKTIAQANFDQLTTRDLPRLEEAIIAMDITPTPEFVERVLARFDPAYEIIAQLDNAQGTQMDQAVVKLLGEWENRKPTLLQRILVLLAALDVDDRAFWTRLVPAVDLPQDESHATNEDPDILTEVLELVDRAGLQSDDDLVRETTLQRIARNKRSSSSDLVANLMNDPNDRIRRAAIQAAGSTTDETMHDDLISSLHHPSPFVQLEAARQLHRRGHEQGSQALRRLMASNDAEVRRAVVGEAAASHHVDREASLRLLQLGLADPKLEVRQQAVKGLENVVGHSQAGSQGRWIPIDQQVNNWKRTLSALLQNERPENPALDRMKQEAIQRSLDTLPIAN